MLTSKMRLLKEPSEMFKSNPGCLCCILSTVGQEL
ncbi:hypothetical protein ACHAXS_000643 [Conticribra weissflogii]